MKKKLKDKIPLIIGAVLVVVVIVLIFIFVDVGEKRLRIDSEIYGFSGEIMEIQDKVLVIKANVPSAKAEQGTIEKTVRALVVGTTEITKLEYPEEAPETPVYPKETELNFNNLKIGDKIDIGIIENISNILRTIKNLKSVTSLLLNKGLDLFFPKKCLGCSKSDTYLCETCFEKIEIIPRYEKLLYLDRLISTVDYRNPLVQELIKKFKYHYIKELSKPLSRLLIKSLKCWTLDFQHNALVMPVPLYKTKERTRGFNQAELLAKELADYFNLPLETNTLKRIIPTIPQVDIKNDGKRMENIKGAFAVGPERLVERKNIILIDDVSTTGATLSEAGKILKKSGANEVWALVVARG